MVVSAFVGLCGQGRSVTVSRLGSEGRGMGDGGVEMGIAVVM